MKIKELIEKLQQFDPELMVMVDGYEDGYDDPIVGPVKKLKLNENAEWYNGKYEWSKTDEGVEALLIERPKS